MYLKILLSIMYTFLAASFCVGDLEQCSSPFFTPGGPYDISRRTILSTLDTHVLPRNGFYYNDSVGEGGGKIYAMGLCLPVALQELCSNCIKAVSKNLLQKCLNESNSYEYGEDSSKGTVCLVRYSEVSFFNSLAQEPVALHCGADSIGNVTEFESIWKVFVEDMIKAASTKAYYATKVSPPMGSQRIYSLMLCIPQMSSKNCEACLRESVSTYQRVCDGKLGTNIRRPSCFFKWEIFPFYHDFPDPKEPTPSNSQVPQPASSPSDILPDDKKISTGIIVAIVVSAVIFAVLLTLGLVLLKKRISYRRLNLEFNADHITSSQSLKFDFKKLEAATNKFSVNNKVGEGGFGEVYMGKLNGTEIAVKRLSKNSGQGIKEFESEVALVAKLQHRNLVSLLGFCLEKDEQILVYEFVPNKSLDYFLFDPTKRGQLDWRRRYNIIKGIIRGILYLHQDSRLKIIHRDLKASNILLDADMIPKIADFGTARIFGGQQTRAIASKIAGTLGYMAPEYAMEGQFSMKSDVYSFGVLLLEILSGKMNTSGLQTEGSTGNLVKDAWRLWGNNSGLELVDPTFGEDYQSDEVTRCIHIALLCVQQDPQDRPTMSTIISQLTSTSINLEVPRAPGIFQSNRDRDSEAEGSNSFGKPVPCSNTQSDPR